MRPSNIDVLALARQARSAALLGVLRARPDISLDQLIGLISGGKYADELGELRVVELHETTTELGVRPGEAAEHAVMRVFSRFDHQWLSSGFFVRFLGLERWTAQKICGELAAKGLLDRRGRTSATRYRLSRALVQPARAGSS